ncbi:ABC transporter substrate-binding protein [Sinorhizobium psoraleae]|uniref:ABC transporter substrate-binding protein n=1 Tax=Sinorhizobium psoraleae TaxID=520838 RepID=UPI0015682DC2|nr:ABC transporter substrate-binding protein [Sinorhizobium psoraleae]
MLLASSAALGAYNGLAVPAFARASRENTLRVVWPYEIGILDPIGVAAQRSTWCACNHVYDRLVSFAAKERPDGTRQYDPNVVVPELAESWEFSSDKKTVTFKIRSGAKFHDGSPVTAEDVRWSIERLLNETYAADVIQVAGITTADQLSAPDDQTFVVKLREPSHYSVSVFSIPFAVIINKKLAVANASSQDPWAKEWLKFNTAGGGAFKIESSTPQQLVLVRNDEWITGPLPKMEQVIFQTVPDATTRTAIVERGSADVAIEIPPTVFAGLKKGKALPVAIPMPNQIDYIAFNSQAAPFNDVRVRQAIAYSLPDEAIFKSVFLGLGTPLFGRTGNVQPGLFPQPTSFSLNLEKAKALMSDAGLAGGFASEIGYAQEKAAISGPLALAIKDAVAKIGIDLQISQLPGAQLSERSANRSLPMLIDNQIAWLSQPDYWFRVLYTGNGASNAGNYQSKALESMLKALPGDASEEEYGKRTAEMADLVLKEIPLLPLRQGAYLLAMAKGITGYTYWFHGLPDARSLSRT